MTSVRRLFLLCYDIADPVRLQRVGRCMNGHGVRIQYSIFVVPTDRHRLDAVLAELEALIDPREDDIRAYPIDARRELQMLGKQLIPQGIVDQPEMLRRLRPPRRRARRSGKLRVVR